MPKHDWIIEEVDGGPAGSDECYYCTVCGCCGGGVWGLWGNRRMEPRPFLPGAAVDLSADCSIAHQQITFYVRGYLRAWEGRLKQDTQRNAFVLLVQSDRWTPAAVERVGFYQLVWDTDHSCFWDDDARRYKTPALDEVRAKLVGLGFSLVSPKCVKCGKDEDVSADNLGHTCYWCWKAERNNPTPKVIIDVQAECDRWRDEVRTMDYVSRRRR